MLRCARPSKFSDPCASIRWSASSNRGPAKASLQALTGCRNPARDGTPTGMPSPSTPVVTLLHGASTRSIQYGKFSQHDLGKTSGIVGLWILWTPIRTSRRQAGRASAGRAGDGGTSSPYSRPGGATLSALRSRSDRRPQGFAPPALGALDPASLVVGVVPPDGPASALDVRVSSVGGLKATSHGEKQSQLSAEAPKTHQCRSAPVFSNDRKRPAATESVQSWAMTLSGVQAGSPPLITSDLRRWLSFEARLSGMSAICPRRDPSNRANLPGM